MADNTKVSIEFAASTAAAVSEVSALSTSIRENATAATVAGSAQQQLGLDVARARAQQIEATAATRGAQQALAEHTATVQAFGARSAEATASAAKLAAAEAQAQRAAKEAADAVARLAGEVKAVAAAEDGDLSPATKRAAAQVGKMGEQAERTASDLKKLELQQKKGAGGFDVMGFASGKLMNVLGPAALGGTLIAVAGWIGDAAEKALQYETALANLPWSLEGARTATHGLVSEQALMAAAASATSLKVTSTSKDFETLAAASVKLAQKLGQPADQLLNNLVTALGRGSTELLDNAGVVLKTSEAQERYAKSIGKSVAALTDEEKSSAFKTEAFKAIAKAADETTLAVDSNAAAVVRFKVSVGDAWDSIERSAANGAGAMVKALGEVGDVIANDIFHDEEWIALKVEQARVLDNTWSPAFTRGAGEVGKWSAEVLLGAQSVAYLQSVLGDTSALETFNAANALEREKRDLMSEEAAYSERMAKAIAAAEKSNESFLDAQAQYQAVLGPQEAPKKKAGKKKKVEEFSSNSGTNAIVRGYDGAADTEIIAAAAPEAAAEGVAEREAMLFEQRQLLAEREMELLDAQAERESERVDSIFFTLEVENEAETRRAQLQDQRLEREREYAAWQVRSARTDAQREAAQTKMEEVEHRKRLAITERAVAEERALMAQRQATVAAVTGHVTQLGGAMVDAAWQAAEGTKGAGLQALSDYLENVAKQMAVKALVETALGVSALAGVVTAGLAPGHFAAAGVATAAAVAAGGASAGLSAAADSVANTGGGGRPAAAGGASGAANGPGSGGPAMGGERERLERQVVPISYRDESAGPSVVIQIQTYVGGKDSAQGLAREVQKAMTRSKAQGVRT